MQRSLRSRVNVLRFLRGLPISVKQRQVSHSRAPSDRRTFVDDIVASGGDRRVASFLWDHLKAFIFVPGLTPYPDDSLDALYGIVEEDLDIDIVIYCCKELGVRLPDQQAINDFGRRIDTPRDVAQFIAWLATG